MKKTWDSPVKNLKHQQKLYGELKARKTDAEPTPISSPLPPPKQTCMSSHIGKDTKPRFSQNPRCPSFKTVDCSGAIYNISFFIGINPTYKINRVKVTSVSKLEWLGMCYGKQHFDQVSKPRDTGTHGVDAPFPGRLVLREAPSTVTHDVDAPFPGQLVLREALSFSMSFTIHVLQPELDSWHHKYLL